ncbi:hypothetical protein GGR56DRAFT_458285 [Xylariaceae sp. FL0804]|nr:hypothetical protein GGR56DRAFT_458285 [Xylariaceae sp. FL0804]
MADRAYMASRTRRPPLGDATDRVVNAAPTNPARRSGRKGTEPNPLRAHPLDSAAGGADIPTYSNLVTQPTAENGAPPSNHRMSAISQEDRNGSKRNSQFSTSSGVTTSSGKRKTHIGPWELGKTLGKGSAGRVRLARHEHTKETVAVKIIPRNATQMSQSGSLAELDKWDRKRDEFSTERQMPLSIEREVAMLKLIDHPHINKLYDIWENRSEIYLVLEYMDVGDLFTYINQRGPLEEWEMMGYFRQILSALEYVHSFNICHRDLKPENILMAGAGIVKIADFGMAAIQQSPNHTFRTSCGSPHYAAPELASRNHYRGDRVDVWSLGILLYAALCARLPFDDPDGDIRRLMGLAVRGEYEVPDWLSDDAQDLIRRMLTVDPARRITISNIWRHPLVRKYGDLDDLHDENEDNRLRQWRTGQCEPVPPEELDMQTLRQLKSMYHTFSEKHIAMQLMSPEPNDQKLFYWLLQNYREKRLEDYDTKLAYSSSDYHHLQPVTWKRKFTTAQFPSRYGRAPSRFTVISNVATEVSDSMETATDGGGTIQSYDPYKSSLVMDDGVASHAKIVIHRNTSSAKDSMQSSTARRMRSGSFKSSSTYSRPPNGSRRITTPAAMRASRRSLNSVRSGESAAYTRPASRHKRRVDFSQIRKRAASPDAPASIAGDDTTYDRGSTASRDDPRTRLVKDSNGRARNGTKSMANVRQSKDHGLPWKDEMRLFSHSIAKDCDEAFNSSLLSADSYLAENSYEPAISEDARSMSFALNTPTPGGSNARPDDKRDSRPWDVRPLPPAPPPTDSVLHEITMAKRRAERRKDGADETSKRHNERIASELNVHAQPGEAGEQAPADRRHVSAPIYSQYSTQWGKDKIPLPSIYEGSRNGSRERADDKPRIASAPVNPAKAQQPATLDENVGLEYLARHADTIRVVTSPSAQPSGVSIPAPLNIRKKLHRGATAYPQSKQELSLRQQYVNEEPRRSTSEDPSLAREASSATVKKKSSWFKRGSKDKDDVFNSKVGSVSSHTEQFGTTIDTDSSTGRVGPPAKKKGFNLAFWRNNKEQPEMRLSLADAEFDDSPSPEAARMFSYPGRPHQGKKWGEESTTRNIEPQQNWLARLFRVKPATKHLCFSISRRRVRQEIAILLREWRKYGIRDVQVDKERNLVFARVGKKNYLNLKEVSFAAEIMTVIEHGKRSQLCIARFTQERGAASSFHKVVDTMNSVFSVRNLMVVDKRKSKMMIKTLNAS